MLAPPIPPNETRRLAKLRSYDVLDTLPEESFDRVTRLAAEILEVPIALVSLIDADRQWFKSRVGLDASQTSREISFCGHAIGGDGIFEIQDATKDIRFADNPLVIGGPKIRFYAGAPLHTPDGLKVGTLCAIDAKPRKLTAREHNLLLDLSQIVVDEMELRIALKASMTAAANEIDERNLQNDFISSVTHELRTPLTSIQGSLRLIDAGALGEIPAPLKSALGIASRNSDTLLRLINDLLDFQKLGAGRMEFKFQTVSSGHLLRTTCENIAGLAARKNVLIDNIAEQDATFLGDNERLSQVLANILSNAVKYSPDGAHITATTWHDTHLVHFSITDRGSGIPPEFQDKMFQKFARARGQSSTSGTGLGLAISKVIVEAHGGTIRFDSSSGGTTFKVALPLRQYLADISEASG